MTMKQSPFDSNIKKRKWGRIGQTLQKPGSFITRQALSWNPHRKHKIDMPKETWRRGVEEELKAVGMKWIWLGPTC